MLHRLGSSHICQLESLELVADRDPRIQRLAGRDIVVGMRVGEILFIEQVLAEESCVILLIGIGKRNIKEE